MTAFEQYIAPGGQRRGQWRVALGLIVIGAFWVAGTAAVLLPWGWLVAGMKGGAGDPVATMLQRGGPEVTAILLLTFAGVWAGMFLVVRLLHRQRFATLFAPEGRVRGRDMLKGLGVAAVFALIPLPIALAIAEPHLTALSAPTWLGWAMVLGALVFMQATAEELIFRGYLLQQLALRSRNPLVWAVIPSALFGALHWANAPTGELAALYVGATFLIGLALAALVYRTGSLWAAIGLHVGFNMVGLTIVGTEGLLSGGQLLLFPGEDMAALMRVDLIVTALILAFVLSPLAPFGPPDGRART